ncbi:hypothetical protein [Nakamurella leprariae]|uniref:Uncharacterized protein n=1 Tax=Nakamurella leprariae TaxID=2803911 RepID=A0A939C0J1_9ACTN|nr:hypothetical protein [Nakamurella leprariae]MBM9469285.1 hypothetical protein [Nakamurella leprariae]
MTLLHADPRIPLLPDQRSRLHRTAAPVAIPTGPGVLVTELPVSVQVDLLGVVAVMVRATGTTSVSVSDVWRGWQTTRLERLPGGDPQGGWWFRVTGPQLSFEFDSDTQDPFGRS